MAYERFDESELILRDELAIDRTLLANERTLLAYLRTAIMLMAAGGTAIKFFGDIPLAVASGWLLVGVGVIAGIFGVWRFAALHRSIRRLTRRTRQQHAD
jgi:putative membrane protein